MLQQTPSNSRVLVIVAVVHQANGEVKEKTPKKKVSQLERTRAEAEALIGDLKKDGEESGGRRTRSQTRGTPAKSPVLPDKPVRSSSRTQTPKAKSESPAKKSPPASKSRGRSGRKSAAAEPVDEEQAAPATTASDEPAASESADEAAKSEDAEGAAAVLANGEAPTSDTQSSDKKEPQPEKEAKEKEAKEPKDVKEKEAKPAAVAADASAEPSSDAAVPSAKEDTAASAATAAAATAASE